VARTARITHKSNCLWVYLDDPDVPRAIQGPKGNFVMVVYDEHCKRLHYEAAIRGYGEDGQVLVDQMVSIADRVAPKFLVGAKRGPMMEKALGIVPMS
jgi:hypothetical protein